MNMYDETSVCNNVVARRLRIHEFITAVATPCRNPCVDCSSRCEDTLRSRGILKGKRLSRGSTWLIINEQDWGKSLRHGRVRERSFRARRRKLRTLKEVRVCWNFERNNSMDEHGFWSEMKLAIRIFIYYIFTYLIFIYYILHIFIY